MLEDKYSVEENLAQLGQQLAAFPGPLKGGSGRQKEPIVEFTRSQQAACLSAEPRANPEGLQMLWGALRIMCQHNGHLCSAMGNENAAGPELTELLVPQHSTGPAHCCLSLVGARLASPRSVHDHSY